MIRGALNYQERYLYSVQTNNPTEAMFKKRREASWLESCGPTAAVNSLSALGHRVTVTTPGGWEPQPEELLLDWFHDYRNAEILGSYEWPNRVMSLYEPAVLSVFGVQCRVINLTWGSLTDHLAAGQAVQLLLKQPGHYIATVAYDDEKDEVLFWDSWPQRFADSDGFNKRMGKDEYEVNTHVTGVLYPRRQT